MKTPPETDARPVPPPYRGGMDPVREIPPAFLRRAAAEATSPSERQALDVIRREGVITRADIARRVGLSGMSMTRIIDGLERRGLVRSTGRIGAGRGPKIGVELVPDAAYSIGVAIKADAVAVTLMDLSGAVLTQSVTLATGRGQPVSLDTIVAAVEAIIADHVPDRRRLFGLGVAITGFFIGQGTLRLVRAEHMRDVRELLGLSRKLLLEESIALDKRPDSRDVILGLQRLVANFAFSIHVDGDHPRFRGEKQTEPVPVSLFTSRSRNHLVESLYDRIDGATVVWCLGRKHQRQGSEWKG